MFSLQGEVIHRLNFFENERTCTVAVGEQIYNYSVAQLFFLSPAIFEHFLWSTEPFRILDEVSAKRTLNFNFFQLCSSFEEINSLFIDKTELNITSSNKEIFQYIGKLLKHNFLSIVCARVFQNRAQSFKFTSECLFQVNEHIHQFKRFKLILNSVEYLINYSLLRCVSDRFLDATLEVHEFALTISNEDLPIFQAFIDVFDGANFVFDDFKDNVTGLINLIQTFQLSCFVPYAQQIFEGIDPLTRSLLFLSLPNSALLAQEQQNAVKYIASNFRQYPSEKYLELPDSALVAILTSPFLQLESEDSLLQFLVMIALSNWDRHYLLQYVRFEYISANLLYYYFGNFQPEHFDNDFLKSLLPRLFSDVWTPSSAVPEGRYVTTPEIQTRGLFYQAVLRYAQQDPLLGNPCDKLWALIHQNGHKIKTLQEDQEQLLKKVQELQRLNQQHKETIQKFSLENSQQSLSSTQTSAIHNEFARYTQRIYALETAISQKDTEIQALKNEISQQAIQLQVLQNQHSQHLSEIQSLQSSSAQQQSEITRLQDEIFQKDFEIQTFHTGNAPCTLR